MTNPHPLIADLRARREALGMSREALAERCGTTGANLWQIESGRRRPSLDMLSRIADALRVELRAVEVG